MHLTVQPAIPLPIKYTENFHKHKETHQRCLLLPYLLKKKNFNIK